MIKPEDFTLFQSKLSFLEHLTPKQNMLLLSGTEAVHYDKGQFIHCAEEQCIGIVLIRQGAVRVYITSEEGREVTLYRLSVGDICILSASCVLDNIDFDVFVDAETDCELLQINAMTFAQLAAENVYVELFSYKLTTERFSDVMWVMQQILFTRFDKRLAAFLLAETDRNGSPEVCMTHEQIARYLGSAREVVSRMLKYFSREGYVTLSRGGILMNDAKSLRAIL